MVQLRTGTNRIHLVRVQQGNIMRYIGLTLTTGQNIMIPISPQGMPVFVSASDSDRVVTQDCRTVVELPAHGGGSRTFAVKEEYAEILAIVDELLTTKW
jgi:hypothetical protein